MTRLLTICLAALALIATGCGGDDGGDKEDYEREVTEVGQTLERTFNDLGESISGSGSAEQAAEKLEQGATSLDEAAADFSDIDPPSDIEESHEQIVSGLEALADEFREGAKAAQEGDVSALLEFAQGLQSSEPVQQITKASDEIESKGYDFGEDGGGGN